jgi:membrane protein
MMTRDQDNDSLRQQLQIRTIWLNLSRRVMSIRPFQLIIQTGLKWDSDNCPGMAAALSYYVLFSLFPLLLVILGIVGALTGPETEAFRSIQQLIVRELPPAVHEMVIGTMIYLGQNSVGAGIVGFSLLFLTASTMFVIFRQSVNRIWGSPARISEAGSPLKMVFFFILNKLVSYLLVLATGILVLVAFLVDVITRAVVEWVSHFHEHVVFTQQVDELQLIRVFQLSSSLFILSMTFWALFRLLPAVRPQWGDVWLGAIITALLLVGLQQFAAGGVVSIFSAFLYYGVIGSVMILMLWVYLACLIVFFGCEISYVYAHLYGSLRSAEIEVAP